MIQDLFKLPNGLQNAAPILGKSNVCPGSKTLVPGRNFRLLGFGVSCVWMNIDRHWHAPNTLLLPFLLSKGDCVMLLNCLTSRLDKQKFNSKFEASA